METKNKITSTNIYVPFSGDSVPLPVLMDRMANTCSGAAESHHSANFGARIGTHNARGTETCLHLLCCPCWLLCAFCGNHY
eukprot:933906-Rhodomonas_salina.1